MTYCPGHITKQEIESVNIQYADLRTMMAKYDPEKLKDGFNKVAGEDIFYISNPGLACGPRAHDSNGIVSGESPNTPAGGIRLPSSG